MKPTILSVTDNLRIVQIVYSTSYRGSLSCFPLELIWNCGSYKQLVDSLDG
jgi:hypothetical protein